MNSKKLKREIDIKCRFCNPPDSDRILFETRNFYIMLSLGPIKEGYLLINSKSHFDCCGLIPDEFYPEFIYNLSITKKILNEVYGACIFYEHGRAGSCLTYTESSKHCHHAHMHCVPIDMNLNEKIEGTLKPITCKNWEDFSRLSKSYNEPYLFVDDGIKQIHIVVEDLRRQYLRFLVANSIQSVELFDWVKHQGRDKINSARIKLLPHFSEIVNEFE